MTKEQKYHELLDKLAHAIRSGKKTDVIEQIKDKIDKIENQMYLKKIKEQRKNEQERS